MRIALVGLGNAGTQLHLPALVNIAMAEVVGVCDIDPARRERARQTWNVPAYDDLDTLLRHAIPEVVIVATPPQFHTDHCLRSLAAGAHVLCEKPLATTLDEADEIIAAARAADRHLALNYEFREMPIARAVLDEVRQPAAGQLRFVQLWQNMNLPPWDEPGWRGRLLHGVLFEAGIHLVDFAIALFHERPRAVSASMSTCGVRPEETDSVALVTLEFSGGRLAHVVQNRLCHGDTQYFEVRADTTHASFRASFGGRARVTGGLFHSTRPHLRLEYGPSGIAWKETGSKRSLLSRNPRNAGMVATRMLLEKTFQAFANGTEPPASGQDGRVGLEALAAAYHSARSGRRIPLDGGDDHALASMPIGMAPA